MSWVTVWAVPNSINTYKKACQSFLFPFSFARQHQHFPVCHTTLFTVYQAANQAKMRVESINKNGHQDGHEKLVSARGCISRPSGGSGSGSTTVVDSS